MMDWTPIQPNTTSTLLRTSHRNQPHIKEGSKEAMQETTIEQANPATSSVPVPVDSVQAKPNSGLFKRNPPIAGEAEAIERAKAGDPEAFSKLYALHKRRVYTLCLRMLGNVSEAEDMTQEAFLHLFRKLGSFRGESAFSTWLHRMTVNLVLMQLRKKGLNLVSLEETINPSEEDAPKRDFGKRDPQLSGSVDRVALERAVALLPPGYRMVFVLHDVEGFEHNEIATMLECSTGNSKSQLHKARLKLRELLRQTEPHSESGLLKEAV
jgi:RNA polymerase sigma-70 factor (ECF subfamily)